LAPVMTTSFPFREKCLRSVSRAATRCANPVPPPCAAELAMKHHLPTVSLSRAFAYSGLLMSYGGSEVEAYRQTTVYVAGF
jgi:hypothetical protein